MIHRFQAHSVQWWGFKVEASNIPESTLHTPWPGPSVFPCVLQRLGVAARLLPAWARSGPESGVQTWGSRVCGLRLAIRTGTTHSGDSYDVLLKSGM